MEIAILGAGVGGVTTALALIQQGYKVSLFERTAEPAQFGAGIVIWPNASFVLNELGLLPAVAALSGRPEKMRRVSVAGEDLGFLDITALDKRMGYPSYSILRRDLQSVLLHELSRRGVEVHYNHTVTLVEAGEHGCARIHFFDSGFGFVGKVHHATRPTVIRARDCHANNWFFHGVLTECQSTYNRDRAECQKNFFHHNIVFY